MLFLSSDRRGRDRRGSLDPPRGTSHRAMVEKIMAHDFPLLSDGKIINIRGKFEIAKVFIENYFFLVLLIIHKFLPENHIIFIVNSKENLIHLIQQGEY